jgi:hypothetical protein
LNDDDASSGGEYSYAQLEWTEGSNRVAITYPAGSATSPGGYIAGADVPFAEGLSNAPVVILLPGNGGGGGDLTYTGYSYFQSALARHGITAVSIGGSPGSGLTARDEVVREVMVRLLGAPFRWKLNLQNVGMMGHSAGGSTVRNIAASPPPGMKVRAALMLGTQGGDGAGFPDVDGFMTLLPAAEGTGACPPGALPGCERNPGYPDVPGAIELDTKRPTPFNVQLYVHRANHYSWNRASLTVDAASAAVPPVFSRTHHELILRSYGTAFFRAILQDMPAGELEQVAFFRRQDGPISHLNGHRVPTLRRLASPSSGVYGDTTVDPADLVVSWRSKYLLTVDDFQQNNGATTNSLGLTASSGFVVDEHDCASTCSRYAGRTKMLFLTATCASGATCPGASYRTELGPDRRNLARRAAVLVRAGEPYPPGGSFSMPAIPPAGVSFALGLEDTSGAIHWKNASEVGGVPRPYARNDLHARWVLKTLRFPISCFTSIDTTSVVAIHLRPESTDAGRQIAFDDLALE